MATREQRYAIYGCRGGRTLYARTLREARAIRDLEAGDYIIDTRTGTTLR